MQPPKLPTIIAFMRAGGVQFPPHEAEPLKGTPQVEPEEKKGQNPMYRWHRSFWLLVVVVGIGCPTDVRAEKSNAKEEPLCLDIARFHVKDHFRAPVLASFLGRQVIDGLPFEVGGEARLFGQTPASRGEKTPYTLEGIRIGRRFDELHLIHHAAWADVEGQTIAYVCLNYADGTKFIFPIRYGVHVRDWFLSAVL